MKQIYFYLILIFCYSSLADVHSNTLYAKSGELPIDPYHSLNSETIATSTKGEELKGGNTFDTSSATPPQHQPLNKKNEQESVSKPASIATFLYAGLPLYSEWEGTVTGLPPVNTGFQSHGKARIEIFNDFLILHFSRAGYPEVSINCHISSLVPGQTSLSFNAFNDPLYPWTMTETSLTGIIGGAPNSGAPHLPQFEINYTRSIFQVRHFNSLPQQPKFIFPKLLGTPGVDSGNTFYVCADGTEASIFVFKGGLIDYNDTDVRIESGLGSDENKIGKFRIISQDTDSLVLRYRHPLFLPSNKNSADLRIELYQKSSQTKIYSFQNIHVVHAPVLMVHGFNVDDPDVFKKMESDLIASGGWTQNFLLRAYYGPTSRNHFSENSAVIHRNIEILLQNVLASGCAVGKVNIVGHSMGGLLTRLYLQSIDYHHDIYKIITLNTPHSGSQAANMSFDIENNSYTGIRSPLLQLITSKLDRGAMTDLAVDSDAIKSLNKIGTQPGDLNYHTAPFHSIVTTYPWSQNVPFPGEIGKNFNVYVIAGSLGINLNLVFGELTHDLVVAATSQLGKRFFLSNSFITSQIHIGSMDNQQVINRTKELLNSPVTGQEFDNNGYDPVTLIYKKFGEYGLVNIPQAPQVSMPMGTTGNAMVRINSPSLGKLVQGGSTLQIQASGAELDSLWVLIQAPGDSLYYGYQLGNTANFTFTIDKADGYRSVLAIGKTSTGAYVSDTSHFFITNNFCKSIQSGNWTNSSIWSCGHEPIFLDDVQISSGHTVTINSLSTANRLVNEGHLTFANNGNLNLNVTPAEAINLSGNLDFGQVPVGHSVTRTLQIKNLGQQLTITGLQLPLGFSGTFSDSLSTGESKFVEITFTPTEVGDFSGHLSVLPMSSAFGNSILLSASGISNTLNEGLVMYLPFTGNADDQSGNTNNGVNMGATLTTDRLGNINQAYGFQRSSRQFIKVPHSPTLDITNSEITISAWVRPVWDGNSTHMQIVSKAQNASNTGRKFGIATASSSQMNFELRTSTGTLDQDWQCTACLLQPDSWQFLTIVYNGSHIKWYRNGTLLYQLAKTGNIVPSTTDLTIGCFSDQNQSFFNGAMDEIRIYNRALSENEINLLYEF